MIRKLNVAKISIIFIIPCILWMLSGLFIKDKDVERVENGRAGTLYSTKKIARSDFNKVIRRIGEVAAKYDADIYSEVSGKLIKLYVKSGQALKKGERIADIASGEAVQSLARAKSKLAAENMSYEGAKQLYEKKIYSKYEIEKRRSALEEAKAAVIAAESFFDKHNLVAYDDCRIYNVDTYEGQIIRPMATKLCSCVNDGRMLVGFFLSADEISEIGDSVEKIVINAGAKEYAATVRAINRAADDAKRNFFVEVEVKNENGALLTGQMADVFVTLKSRPLYHIPHSALSLDDQGALSVKVLDRAASEDAVKIINIAVIDEDLSGVWADIKEGGEAIEVFVSGHKYLKDGAPLSELNIA